MRPSFDAPHLINGRHDRDNAGMDDRLLLEFGVDIFTVGLACGCELSVGVESGLKRTTLMGGSGKVPARAAAPCPAHAPRNASDMGVSRTDAFRNGFSASSSWAGPFWDIGKRCGIRIIDAKRVGRPNRRPV